MDMLKVGQELEVMVGQSFEFSWYSRTFTYAGMLTDKTYSFGIGAPNSCNLFFPISSQSEINLGRYRLEVKDVRHNKIRLKRLE